MRKELRTTYTAQYMAGRGGKNVMTQSDWGKVGNMLKGQYAYLNDFAKEIASGKLSQAQIAARAGMYTSSASQAYERGKVAAYGAPDLPAYPGDGATACRGNCKCRWSIKETKTSWVCRWVLSAVENCGDCVERAGKWNPLVIEK